MRFLVEVSRGEGRRLDGGVRREGDNHHVPFWGIAELVGVLEALLDEASQIEPAPAPPPQGSPAEAPWTETTDAP